MKKEHSSPMLVQRHQLEQADNKISDLDMLLSSLAESQSENEDTLDSLLAEMESMFEGKGLNFDENNHYVSDALNESLNSLDGVVLYEVPAITLVEKIDVDEGMSWTEYSLAVEEYAQRNKIDLTYKAFYELLSPSQKVELEKKIKNDFIYKNAQCDKYDYLIAGTCGAIGGLIDIFFVGTPKTGVLTKQADNFVDGAVEKFAKLNGWNGPREGKDPTNSAIGFLETKFKINYDQATTNGKHGTGGAVNNLSASNHHVKSLGHSPDLVGLFFSIYNQFTDTSSFVSNGKLITIDTETFELKGGNFIAKVFCGFVNWIGHLFSDMAGSSGAQGRGSGIPIPFYNFFLLLDFGEFGQHKQTFATIATKVFEQGYDMRHGLAMAIPVLITELLTRVMWVCKSRFYHKKDWGDCIPSANNPELRRMLFVAHGTLCLLDAGDAAVRSGGEIVQFLLRTNLIGWVRFGSLAYKEILAWGKQGHINGESVDEYLEADYKRMLSLR